MCTIMKQNVQSAVPFAGLLNSDKTTQKSDNETLAVTSL